MEFNFTDIDTSDLELTAEEIALCDACVANRRLQNEIRHAEYQAEVCKATSPLEAYWSGSISASVARDVKKGRVRKIYA